MAGDLTGHVGKDRYGYDGVHGGHEQFTGCEE